MSNEQKEQAIRTYLKEQGFKPRDDKDIYNYIRQLNVRLGKQGKKISIKESNDDVVVELVTKQPIVRRNKALYVRVTTEEQERYEQLAKSRNTDLSKLIRDLLEKECDANGEPI